MKPSSQPVFLSRRPCVIQDVWEVRLSQKLWQRIVAVAAARKSSYSQVSRFCAFRLAERSDLNEAREVRKGVHLSRSVRIKDANTHRHLMCLYGEDMTMIRLAAMRLNLTVSAFIRLALELYLHALEMEIHICGAVTEMEYFWRGIKRWFTLPLTVLNEDNIPIMHRYLFSGFPPEMWWGSLAAHTFAAA